MTHSEFMQICIHLGAPQRGWQKSACAKATGLGFNLSQPTLSITYNQGELDETKNISLRTAKIMRALAAAVASGDMSPGFQKKVSKNETEYQDPDDAKEDDELLEEIKESFQVFQECAEAVMIGSRHGAIISSPPGTGKSHTISVLESKVAGVYLPTTGDISAVNLYKQMYAAKDGGVLAFDDCDGVFADETKLNLLKGALDSKRAGQPRLISWLKESRSLIDEDEVPIPKSFDFQGRIIFMTNIDFDREIARNTRLTPHLKALLDRCGYLSLGLSSMRRRRLWVSHVCAVSSIMEDSGVAGEAEKQEVLDFIAENENKWRHLNLRLVVNLCKYKKEVPARWRQHGKALLMKPKK